MIIKQTWKRLIGILCMVAIFVTTIPMNDITASAASTRKLNITNLILSKGQTQELKLSGKGAVTWKSSKKSVVTVSKKGKVTAKKNGDAVITAISGKKKYTCRVTVSSPLKNKTSSLIVYFSYSGTTRKVASRIKSLTGGDVLEVKVRDSYSADYDKTANRAKREHDKNILPKITTVTKNIKNYKRIYVGFPIWWHSTPKAIDTFLKNNKSALKGKTIIPFCTSGGSDIEEAMPAIKKYCKNSTILEGYTANSGSKSEIKRWLVKIGMLEGATNKVEPSSQPTSTPVTSIQPTSTPVASNQPTSTPVVSSKPTNTPVASSQPTSTPQVSIRPTVMPTPSTPLENTDKRILVAYFSWSGNTEEMANYIQVQTGADILEIEPENPYPTDYTECGNLARIERDENVRPEIANLPESVSDYDVIFIGYPIWWHTAPMIIGTFLENYDLSGVDIYPFTQSASMDTEQFQNSMEFVRECAKGANVYDGLFTRASNRNGILEYLKENGLIKSEEIENE